MGDAATVASPVWVDVSHDGTRVAYSVVTVDSVHDTNQSGIWLARADGEGETARRLTEGTQDSHPVFSPNGQEVAFLRPVDGVDQIFSVGLMDSAVRQVTSALRFPWGVSAPVWAPEGHRLAFLAEISRSGSVPGANGPIVVERLDYFDDVSGLHDDRRAQVFVVDLLDAGLRQITDSVGGAGQPSWSPEGRLLAFTLEVGPRPDLTGHRAAHVADPLDHTASPRRVGEAEHVVDPLLWADGGKCLVAAGLSTFDVAPAELFVLSVDGTDPDRMLTKDFDGSVMTGSPAYPGAAPALQPDGTHVLFCARDRGQTHVFRVPFSGGDVVRVFDGGVHVVSSLAVAGGAPVAAVVVATDSSFGQVLVVDLATGLTAVVAAPNDRLEAGLDILRPERREFTLDDGAVVDAWVLRSPEATGPSPLLLDVHGGPHNAWSGVLDPAHLYQQELADRGWTVVMPNPPGSDGYGADFYRAVLGRWGTSDAPSLLAVVDELVTEGTADASRLAVTGYSYGGFMVCHLTSMTDRFAAAAAGGLICDLADFGASSDEGGVFGEVEFGGSAVDDRARLVAASPISRVRSVTTPTLVLHGQGDHTCPVGQSEQWFDALARREVPTQLVLYPGSSHLFIVNGRPSHRVDYQERLLAWVTRHTMDAPATGARSAQHWQARLNTVIECCGVPGAQLGILELDAHGAPLSSIAVAAGVLDRRTGAPASVDSLFQIGSISKIWTAVLIMQLVDEGQLDLDDRVVDVVGTRVAKDDEAITVTVRQLLDHTSGIDGDRFVDFGRGDESIADYVEALANTNLVHRPARGWSYCNAGWVVAGRIVEMLRGSTWDEAVRQHIIDPLGLQHAILLPEEALLHAAAVGHEWIATLDARPVTEWGMTRALGPAGLVTASVADLLAFAGTLMRDGALLDGSQLLSSASAQAMRTPSVDLRALTGPIAAWGLGWFIEDWDGEAVYGHDGSTIGQKAYLRVFPKRQMAVVLLTNGGHADRAYHDLFSEISTMSGGPAVPSPLDPGPATPHQDLLRFTGSYRTAAARIHIEMAGSQMTATIHEFGEPGSEDQGPQVVTLHPAGEGTFVARLPQAAFWQSFTFCEDEDGTSFLQHSKRRMVRE